MFFKSIYGLNSQTIKLSGEHLREIRVEKQRILNMKLKVKKVNK